MHYQRDRLRSAEDPTEDLEPPGLIGYAAQKLICDDDYLDLIAKLEWPLPVVRPHEIVASVVEGLNESFNVILRNVLPYVVGKVMKELASAGASATTSRLGSQLSQSRYQSSGVFSQR